jgi:hypothetical protein
MTLCVSLLKTDGCVVVQTPCFREQSSYGDMVASNDPFLQQMKSDEHLFLLSQRAVRRFMQQAGASEVVFEPAFFGHYDMAFVASGSPLKSNSPQAIERALLSTPGGRLVQAILDLDAAGAQARAQFATCEADRAERGKQIDTLLRQLALSEEDRAARLDVINRLSAQLAAREAECAAQRKLIEELRAHVDRNEKLKGTGQA